MTSKIIKSTATIDQESNLYQSKYTNVIVLKTSERIILGHFSGVVICPEGASHKVGHYSTTWIIENFEKLQLPLTIKFDY